MKLGPVKLVVFGLLMFGFSFALVPLYDVFCEITGINGKTNAKAYEGKQQRIDENRWVEVQFSEVSSNLLGVKFFPNDRSIRLHPGQIRKTAYVLHNQTNENLILVAVPSVAPAEASIYLQKLDCFCFEKQVIAPNAKIKMPVVFLVESSLPQAIEKMTLNYTVYRDTKSMSLNKNISRN